MNLFEYSCFLCGILRKRAAVSSSIGLVCDDDAELKYYMKKNLLKC